MKKQKVLFICKDSAVRSQLAAAFLNAYFGDRYEVYYAGVEPSELNPYAAKVMKEIGIDISSYRPRKIKDLCGNKFDCIITLCDFALAHLPTPSEHKKQLHQGFKDFCIPMLCENAKKFPMCFP
jgi:arsenate reductase